MKLNSFTLKCCLTISVLLSANEITKWNAPISGQEYGNSDVSALMEDSFHGQTTWRNFDLLHSLDNHNSPINDLVFHPKGEYLVSVGSFNDPRMRFWQVAEGQEVHHQRADGSAMNALVYSPDGKTIVSSGQSSHIRIWNGDTGAYESSLLLHANNVTALAITPDSETLVSGGLDGIRVWNLVFRRPAYILTGVGNPSYALGIHPNGRTLASGDGRGRVTLWDLTTAQKIGEIQPHQSKINGLVFTPDGRYLLTSSEERMIKVWDVATRRQVSQFGQHGDRIRTIALSPDGTTLASGGNDGVRIWDFNTREQIGFIPYSQDWVNSLAFSPDSTILATGSFNTRIDLWQKGRIRDIVPQEE